MTLGRCWRTLLQRLQSTMSGQLSEPGANLRTLLLSRVSSFLPDLIWRAWPMHPPPEECHTVLTKIKSSTFWLSERSAWKAPRIPGMRLRVNETFSSPSALTNDIHPPWKSYLLHKNDIAVVHLKHSDLVHWSWSQKSVTPSHSRLPKACSFLLCFPCLPGPVTSLKKRETHTLICYIWLCLDCVSFSKL